MLCLSFALAGTPASARVTRIDGVSYQNLAHWDNAAFNTSSFSSGYFPNLFRTTWVGGTPASHIKLARFVVPWDVMADTHGPENEQPGRHGELDFKLLSAWLEDVKWLGLTPVVAVEQSPTEAAGNGVKLPPLVPKSRAEYEQYVSSLLTYAASVGEPIAYLEAWNEPNNRGVEHPRATEAAEFMNGATALCVAHGCTAIAGDFLDSEFRPAVEQKGGLGVKYEEEYDARLNPLPANWGFHPYAALKYQELTREESTIAKFEAHLPKIRALVWFTEVGAYFCQRGGGYPNGGQAEREAQQKKNAEYLNTLLSNDYEVAHAFYFEFSNGYRAETDCATRSDTSLYNANDQMRSAATVVFGGTPPPPTPPPASTGAASGVLETQARLTATVSPDATDSHYYFQYGTTTGYGSQAPVAPGGDVGSGTASFPAGATVLGLDSDTVYHYRVVASSYWGTIYGGDQAVTTPEGYAPAVIFGRKREWQPLCGFEVRCEWTVSARTGAMPSAAQR